MKAFITLSNHMVLNTTYTWCEKKRDRQTDNRTQVESLVLSTISANQELISNLILVLAFPRNMALNQELWKYLIRTCEAIHLIDPICPQRKVNLPLCCSNFLSLPLSVSKTLSFCTAFQGSFPFSRWYAAEFINH